jgi:hypothetical protein
VSDDLHAPTSAGPQPETAWAPVGDGVTGAPGQAADEPLAALAAERPEVLVGAAFAGGVLAALILKRLGRR